ncbi:MAG: hypothetical protein IJG51_11240 [Synergistaceae bacterium]|nr:hypothetical protein [Synergistaceae bacterium]MBQ3347084.1 hypothetical protein [Synergistaceae bacterium]MBQ3399452.1 hypothetical protein [Synergistaceae bacterium]MBQ3759082.1 hypothetical protein [Synergistaceae bacterium]MBQ4400928.1 hypothetical protein [Synergistaceae bacterium]
MALIECKLCRRIYNGFEGQRVCGECIRRLEEIYGHVHEYMRDNQDRDFDLETLADEMEISPVDIQALVDLGYIERDLQTYSRDKKGTRQKLAEAINNEVEKLKRNNITTYGGVVYARENRQQKDENRQYVFDGQKRKL